jgi:hypothetical protein
MESTLRNPSPRDKNRNVHKMCAGYREIPDTKFRRELGLGLIVNWFDPVPVLSGVMRPLSIYPISNDNESPSMFSIRFVSVGFRMFLNDCNSIIF